MAVFSEAGASNLDQVDSPYDAIDPRPRSLVAALRSIGYGLSTAIADLIDNSITAQATKIQIRFLWRGAASLISISDNGRGMTEAALVEAMRPGSHDPLIQRSSSDLGRFGLGLKTASLSQCRSFSVVSRARGASIAKRTWDLDLIINANQWVLKREVSEDVAEAVGELNDLPSGTCVVWERLDRLVGNAEYDNEAAHRSFLEAADQVCEHLSMVFGDYLKRRKKAVEIRVGNKRLQKWDPFLESHDTQIAEEETFGVHGARVTVRPFVVPHHSRLSQKEFRAAAGPAGWNAQQGFYVYRNQRMLVSGGWLTLGLAREEHLKLARIRVDLDTESDAQWQLDIRKARATPPEALREDLRRIARLTRSKASEVYRHRGKKIIDQAGAGGKRLLWQLEKLHDKLRYRIDREHPVVKALIDEGQVGRSVNSLLTLIEETIPAPSIYVGYAEKPNEQMAPFESTNEKTVRRILRDLFLTLREAGNSVDQARVTLTRMVPFDSYPQLIAELEDFDREQHAERRA